MKDRCYWPVFLIILLVPTLCHGQVEIFSDGFEWGSICAWNNNWYVDLDGDGFGDMFSAPVGVTCPALGDVAPNALDCDDDDPTIHPLAFDVCDGIDNDCDLSSADGFDDPSNGAECDGPDTDLCLEGTYACSGGALACSDSTSDDFDICDGIDNDCDGASADGSEDPSNGAACDGPDTDLCLEGTYACSGGALACSDSTSDDFDICDGIDNDCDGASADGSEDPSIGAACDGPDTDLCLEGTFACAGGALACSDATSSSVEACNGTDDDCDGFIDEDFERDDNPLCTSGTFDLGSVSGDTGSDQLSDSWWNEEWASFMITEDNNGTVYLSAQIVLTSPPGVDFDLYVYCASCGGSLAGSSIIGGLTGHEDVVVVRADDSWGSDDTFVVIVEVRHYTSTVCANWTLDVYGNVSASTATCD